MTSHCTSKTKMMQANAMTDEQPPLTGAIIVGVIGLALLVCALIFLTGCGPTTKTFSNGTITIQQPGPAPTPSPKWTQNPRLIPAEDILLMKVYCRNMDAHLTNVMGDVGQDDTDFACEDSNGAWYWIKWGDVKP